MSHDDYRIHAARNGQQSWGGNSSTDNHDSGLGGIGTMMSIPVMSGHPGVGKVLAAPPLSAVRTAGVVTTTTVITYTYDPLSRLTDATYSNGQRFQYVYDEVGNRTMQAAMITSTQVTNYVYDAANRLASGNGQAYTWDDNGNLLSDGTRQYAYDQANRLISATLGVTTTQYAYNGDGARLKYIVNGTPTTYTLDLAAPLVQVLVIQDASGKTAYEYGLTRIGEQQATGWAYHLSDALGSVRQLADGSGQIALARGYTPYGEPLWSQGAGQSAYGFTGEALDVSTGLVFLRARYLNPVWGMFISQDPWSGDEMRPGSMNGFGYVEGNPVIQTDPTGACDYQPGDPEGTCRFSTDPYEFARDKDINRWYEDPDLWHLIESYNPELFSKLLQGWATWGPGDLVYLRPREIVKAPLGESPFDGISGYVEGQVKTSTYGCFIWWVDGEEVVYDFAVKPPHRANFTYFGIGLTVSSSPSLADNTVTNYAGYIWGFDPSRDIVRDYAGPTISASVGASVTSPEFLSFGAGVGGFKSLTSLVYGFDFYTSAGANVGDPGVAATFSFLGTWYSYEWFSDKPFGNDERPAEGMYSSIFAGEASPVYANPIINAARPSVAEQVYRVLGRYYASKPGWPTPLQ